jgi:hypothetical protein
MEEQKIKIELELTPEMALLLSVYLKSTAQGNLALQEMLTETGIKNVQEIAQNIKDQLSDKTDIEYLTLRSYLSILKRSDDVSLNLSAFSELFN